MQPKVHLPVLSEQYAHSGTGVSSAMWELDAANQDDSRGTLFHFTGVQLLSQLAPIHQLRRDCSKASRSPESTSGSPLALRPSSRDRADWILELVPSETLGDAPSSQRRSSLPAGEALLPLAEPHFVPLPARSL